MYDNTQNDTNIFSSNFYILSLLYDSRVFEFICDRDENICDSNTTHPILFYCFISEKLECNLNLKQYRFQLYKEYEH